MAERKILHCDLNNFFASVSLLFNPTLVDSPVAVCGSEEVRHGIVLAKNEIAKSYGVKTAEAIWEAKAKCPNLIILPPLRDKYYEYSKAVYNIYSRYTDIIEPFGIDECWLDVTGSTLLFGNEEEIAHRIRKEIKKELGLTISVGVSFNKVFAKLGSDMKKPDAVTVITKDNFKELVWPLPVSELLFVGKSTAERLKSAGIFTIGDVSLCSKEMLERLLGKHGETLLRYALGEDNSPVQPPRDDEKPKSIGRSVTPPQDIVNDDDVWKIFLKISESIARELRSKNLYAGGLQVHTRTVNLEVKEYSRMLANPANTSMIIAKKGMELFKSSYNWAMPLRSVGLRAVHLKDESFAVQQDMFGTAEQDMKEEKIEDSIETLRKKFGNKSIKRGTVIESEK
ncbi:MAG: DNA polymerase IV [Clostridia bacterium]|nr:DNA polymerase IV [Clostridia bacterium]